MQNNNIENKVSLKRTWDEAFGPSQVLAGSRKAQPRAYFPFIIQIPEIVSHHLFPCLLGRTIVCYNQDELPVYNFKNLTKDDLKGLISLAWTCKLNYKIVDS